MISAFAYIRTSSGAHGALDLARQLEQIYRYAAPHGYLVVAMFLDVTSATDPGRPGLQALTAAGRGSLASTVRVTDTNRLRQAEKDVDELARYVCRRDACIHLCNEVRWEIMSSWA